MALVSILFWMRFLFLGTAVSSSNRGVLALGSSVVGLVRQIDPTAEIKLLIGHQKEESIPYRDRNTIIQVPIVPCRLSLRSQLRHHLVWIVLVALLYRVTPSRRIRLRISRLAPWVSALANADVVGDIRGGDSFSDIYGFKRFLYGFTLASVVLLVRGHIVQLPQTYGPFKGRVAQRMARFLLRRSSVICARDRASYEVATDLTGGHERMILSPDVAFSLRPVAPAELHLDPPLVGPPPKGVIGLNINGLMFNGGYSRKNMFGLKLDYANFLPELVIALLAEHPGEIWLIPHTFARAGSPESDPEASNRVRAALPPNLQHRVRVIKGEYDQHEIKAIIGLCDFFVGSRMHACIAALSQGIPCVGVAYSMKFAGVFESVGMEEWIVDGRTENGDSATKRILQLYASRDDVRGKLAAEVARARLKLLDVFREFLISGISGAQNNIPAPQLNAERVAR